MERVNGKKYVVIGGMGYLGAALCLELVRRGASEVRSFDLRSSSPWSSLLLQAGVQCFQGDVSQKNDLEEALTGTDIVFHLASYGMSGKEMLQTRRVEQININGTSNILDVCHELNIKGLVYVSTCNVIFGGKEILNGDETMSYFPLDEHVDPYGRTKSIAEQLVLKNNARPSKSEKGSCLYTCAIRPGGIYGPGEERHLPRILSLAKMGLLFFKAGSENIKTDWVYIENLVHALILASVGLHDNEGRMFVSAGQAYFISDGEPVNTFEFLVGPLLESLDYNVPKLKLPVPLLLFISRIVLLIYTTILSPWLNAKFILQPFILPAEVYKVGITHHFSIKKARDELGYKPLISPQNGLTTTISYFKDRKKRELDGPNIFVWIYVFVGMLSLFAAAYLPPIGPVKYVHNLGLFIFRSVFVLRIVFVVSVGFHLGEGVYAWFLARKVDSRNASGWFWQTTALGFFSLRFLMKRARDT